VILTSVFVVYALVASRLDRLSITAPMVFVVAGVLLGRSVTDQLHLSLTSEPVLLIVELTLALLLFADASTVRLSEVEGDTHLPGRLLFVGLPLTIALGTVVAVILLPSAGWAAAALIASILAPTDAALGLAIFSALATSHTNDLLSAHDTMGHALTAGYQRALLIGSIFILAAAVIALRATSSLVCSSSSSRRESTCSSNNLWWMR